MLQVLDLGGRLILAIQLEISGQVAELQVTNTIDHKHGPVYFSYTHTCGIIPLYVISSAECVTFPIGSLNLSDFTAVSSASANDEGRVSLQRVRYRLDCS